MTIVSVALAVVVLATAFAVGRVTRRHLPELVSYLAVGALLGPTGAGLIDRHAFESLRPLIQAATAVLMFVVGERLSLGALRASRWIVTAALAGYVASACLVYGLVAATGAPQSLAVTLAIFAGGGAPMTVAAIVQAQGRRSLYGESLVAVHGVCDVAAALTFAFVFPAVVLSSEAGRTIGGAALATFRLGLAGAALGVVLGIVLARLGGSVAAAACIGAGCGLSLALGLSVPLVALVMGATTVTRLAPDRRPAVFERVARLEVPLYLLFFGLAGAAIRLNTLPNIGLAGVAYIAGRSVAKVGSGWLVRGRSFGLDTIPQAGISVALAAVASAQLPGRGIATVTIGSVVVFEVVGAIIVRRHLRREPGLVVVTPPAAAA